MNDYRQVFSSLTRRQKTNKIGELDIFIAQLPIATMLVDIDSNQILAVNQKTSQLIGFPPEELIGISLYDLINVHSPAVFQFPLSPSMNTQPIELKVKNQAPRIFQINTSRTPNDQNFYLIFLQPAESNPMTSSLPSVKIMGEKLVDSFNQGESPPNDVGASFGQLAVAAARLGADVAAE